MDVLRPHCKAAHSFQRKFRPLSSPGNQFFFPSVTLFRSVPLRRFCFPPSSCSCFIRNSRGISRCSVVHLSNSDVVDDWDEEEEEEDYASDRDDLSVAAHRELEDEARDLARRFVLAVDRELTIEEDQHHRKTSGRKGTRASEPKNIPDHLLPRVTIVGRPNVGKSALFNRLVGGNLAIVVDEPGVTRDRLYGRAFWGEHEFMVVDTGGVLTVAKSQTAVLEELAISTTIGMDNIPLASREVAVARMPTMIEKQAASAVEEASVIIFLVDGQAGPTAGDVEIGDWLRKNHSDKQIILAVNKCESPCKGLIQASEFWSLGFSPLPVSAISGSGTGELLDLVCSELKVIEQSSGEVECQIPAIAIVGRPNVGKSSILNALLGEDRTIVSPISGTTRDAIDTEFTASDGQDCNIAERIEKEGKGCVIVVNKWDTIPNKNHQTATYYEQDVREKLRSLDWAPIVYSTATTGQSVDKIISAASMVEQERSRRLGTSILNQLVREALAFKPPPKTRGGRRGRVYYTTQAAVRPPTFVFFVNDAKLFPEAYRRYMEKQLRTDAGFTGTPIRLLWRSKKKTGKVEGKVTGTSTRASSRVDAATLEMAR
ncbi:unnamed protein product [Victoria cruziana]